MESLSELREKAIAALVSIAQSDFYKAEVRVEAARSILDYTETEEQR